MVGLLQPKLLKAAVKGLHWRHSLDIHKLLKDNEDLCIAFNDSAEVEEKVDVEKMVGMLPLHLIAVLMSTAPDRDDKYQYVLCGIRLLQTFCDLTSRHPKLEQVLLDDVKLSGQMLDLVIIMIINLGRNQKESDNGSLIYATLVASGLYLFHGFISPISEDLVKVFLAHSKVDVFVDAAFGAVHNVVRSLTKKLLSRRTDKYGACPVGVVNFHCLQAEASLQFLHSLCQHKSFRDRIAKNKELCGKGGALMLAQSILSLTITPEFVVATIAQASISRMKAKVLSILQHLFEAESVSFLDEVVSAGNLQLATNIASQVLKLLRHGLSKASKATAFSEYPMGFVLLNAMRLADVLTDDSNFRAFFTEHLSMILSAVFSLSHGDFLSMLCSSDISSREDDATLDYDSFTSVGWVLNVFSTKGQIPPPQFKLNFQNNLAMASYAHQRTSLVIKMIANLHCFVPNVCQEKDRNRFIRNFMIGLRKDPSESLVNMLPHPSYTSMAERGTGVCRNLCSLLRHAESLIPSSLNEEDFVLLRVFCDQLQQLIRSEFKETQAQVKEIQGTGGIGSGKQQQRKEPLNLNNAEPLVENSNIRVDEVAAMNNKEEEKEKTETLKERDDYCDYDMLNLDKCNLETSGSDSSSNRGKSPVNNRVEGDELARKRKEDEKAETSQRKKRKRSIMNDDQMVMIEKALAEEPDMQRNSASIQFWADKLSQTGSEVITSSQLKNWLNNRKAKLARANKQTGPVRDSNNSSGDLPESPGDENTTWQQKQPSPFKDQQAASTSSKTPKTGENPGILLLKQGQQVMLMDGLGNTVGKGTVFRTDGEWYGFSLEARRVCVVDVIELIGTGNGSIDWSKMIIPHGSDDVGRTFGEAISRFGVMRVAWDVNKLQFHQNQTQLH